MEAFNPAYNPPLLSPSPTYRLLQLTRRATVVQWQSQADAYTMKLVYYGSINIKGIINNTTAHTQRHDILHTHEYNYVDKIFMASF